MLLFFFFNDTATTEIYTLSLHDALPISSGTKIVTDRVSPARVRHLPQVAPRRNLRSEEHTSELQSRLHLVCRLLLEKKKDQFPARRGITVPSRTCQDTQTTFCRYSRAHC